MTGQFAFLTGGIVLITCACTPVYPVSPEQSNGATILIIRTGQSENEPVQPQFAFVGENQLEFVARFESGVSGEIIRLDYDCTLAELRLSPGRLELVKDPSLRPLPVSARISRANFGRGGVDDWETVDGVPEELRGLRLAEAAPLCAGLVAHQFNPPSPTSAIGLAVALDASSAAVFPIPFPANGLAPVYKVSTSSTVRTTTIAMLEAGAFANRFGLREPFGIIWRTGNNRFTFGNFDDGFAVEKRLDESFDDSSTATWMDGGPMPNGFEVYVLTDYPSLHRIQRTSPDPTAVTLAQGRSMAAISDGGVAWIRPGEAAVAGLAALSARSPNAIAFVSGDDIRFEDVPTRGAALTDVAYVPGWGIVVGTSNGALWLKRDHQEAWEEIVSSAETCGGRIRGLRPTARGIIFSQACPQSGGFVVEYVRGMDPCPEVEVSDIRIADLLPFPNGFLARGQEAGTVALSLVTYENDPPPDCKARGFIR